MTPKIETFSGLQLKVQLLTQNKERTIDKKVIASVF